MHLYKIIIPQQTAMPENGEHIYITVEGYYSEVIPMQCFMDNTDDQNQHPIRSFRTDMNTAEGWVNYGYYVQEDYMHMVHVVPHTDYQPGDEIEVEV